MRFSPIIAYSRYLYPCLLHPPPSVGDNGCSKMRQIEAISSWSEHEGGARRKLAWLVINRGDNGFEGGSRRGSRWRDTRHCEGLKEWPVCAVVIDSCD